MRFTFPILNDHFKIYFNFGPTTLNLACPKSSVSKTARNNKWCDTSGVVEKRGRFAPLCNYRYWMRGAGYNQSKARVPKKVYILVEILPVCDISIVDVWINWWVRPGAFQLFGSAATFRYCTVGSWLGWLEIKPVGEGGAGRWTVHHVICVWLLGSWWSTRGKTFKPRFGRNGFDENMTVYVRR